MMLVILQYVTYKIALSLYLWIIDVVTMMLLPILVLFIQFILVLWFIY